MKLFKMIAQMKQKIIITMFIYTRTLGIIFHFDMLNFKKECISVS